MKHFFTALVAALTLAFAAPALVSNASAQAATDTAMPAQPADAMDSALSKDTPSTTSTAPAKSTSTKKSSSTKKKSSTHKKSSKKSSTKKKTAAKAPKAKDDMDDTGATTHQ